MGSSAPIVEETLPVAQASSPAGDGKVRDRASESPFVLVSSHVCGVTPVLAGPRGRNIVYACT